jgi:hypothetical protein
MKRKSGSPALAGRPKERAGRRFRLRAALICCGMVLLCAGAAAAKKKKPLTKTIQGQVLDQDSHPIVGASVELTDVTTGKTLGIYADDGGKYQFTDLKPTDDYQVRAAYKSQQSDLRSVSAFDDEAVRVLVLTIPGSASQ